MPPRRPGAVSVGSFSSDSTQQRPQPNRSASIQSAGHPPPQPTQPPLLQGMTAAVVNGGAASLLGGVGLVPAQGYGASPVQAHPSHPNHPQHQLWQHQQQQQERELQQQQAAMGQQQQMQAMHLRQQREQQQRQQQMQQQQQQQHDMFYNAIPNALPPNGQPMGQMGPGGAIAGGPMRLATSAYPPQAQQQLQQSQGPPPNQQLQQQPNPNGPPPQQRPIPISRGSTQAQTPQQPPPGMSAQPSPIQQNTAPPPAYRMVSQGGERASPVQCVPPGRVLSGAPPSVMMQDAMRSSVGPPPQERPQIPPHPAILGAQLAAAGIGPISAMAAPVGPALAKLTQFNDALADALDYPPEQVLDELRRVVDEHFTPNGVLKYGLYDKVNGLNKLFEVPCAAFPRFAHINALCGVLRQSTLPSFVREFLLSTPDPSSRQPVHVGFLLKAEEVAWVSRYRSGVQVELLGSLQVHFVVTGPSAGTGASAVSLKIESFTFESKGHEEMISREMIVHERVEKLYESSSIGGDNANGTPSGNNSPVLGKGRNARKGSMGTRRKSQLAEEDAEEGEGGKLGTERAPGLAGISYESAVLPLSPVGSFGIPEMGMRCLEIAESVAQLQDLIAYSVESNVGPIQSLNRFAESFRQSQAHAQPQLSGHLASTIQTNNAFYSSVGPPPGPSSPQPMSAISSQNRPPSGEAADSPQPLLGSLKRKAGAPPPNGVPGPGTPTPVGGLGDVSMVGGDVKGEYPPNGHMDWQGGAHGAQPSPKMARGGGGAGRGRGRGRGVS